MVSNQENDFARMFVENIIDSTRREIEEKVKVKLKELDVRLNQVSDILNNRISEFESILNNCPLSINLGTVEEPKNEIVHKSFSKIIKILESSKRKEKNIMLVGGAGGGKTHLVKQISEALKLQFYPFSVGLQTTKSDLLGFINARGVYMPSVIRKAYEDGGVLLLDEFDAAHPGVVTILNSLLANGCGSFPDKVVHRNKNFVCICACNTYGRGNSLDYIGRNRLDGATLDRFIVVDVDYDKELEKALTKNDFWFKVVNKVRENSIENGIKIIVSPRAALDGADLLDAGFSIQEVIDMTILKGIDKDSRNKLLKDVNLKYFASLAKEEYLISLEIDFDKFKYKLSMNEQYSRVDIKNERLFMSEDEGQWSLPFSLSFRRDGNLNIFNKDLVSLKTTKKLSSFCCSHDVADEFVNSLLIDKRNCSIGEFSGRIYMKIIKESKAHEIILKNGD